MLVSLIVTTFLESYSMAPGPMACTFPAMEPDQRPIEIEVSAQPSLKDLPGLYRVRMDVDGHGLNAAAQPITGTKGRDVLVRASGLKGMLYAMGFDDNGAAALNVVKLAEAGEPEAEMSRTGNCRNYERYIQSWARP